MNLALQLITACLLVLGGLTAGGAEPKPKWLISKPVVYAENHDPSMVWLKDGTQLEVRFGVVSWETVASWKAGRRLNFAYSSTMGPVLVDELTGRTLPVVSGWKKHPLEEYLDGLNGRDGSTTDMVQALNVAHDLWKKELQRVYSELRSRVTAKQRERLIEAQARWEHFKNCEIEFLRSLDDENAGTIGRVIAGDRVVGMVRERALTLGRY